MGVSVMEEKEGRQCVGGGRCVGVMEEKDVSV